MKRLFATAFLIILCTSLFAQLFPGFNNSNYAGVSALDLNPGSIADNRLKVDVNLAGLEFDFRNNYVGFLGSPRFLISEALKENRDSTAYNSIFDDTLFQENHLIERISEDDKSVFLNLDIHGPGVMVVLGPKSAGAYTTRFRTMLNVDGISPDLAKLIWEGLEYPALWAANIPDPFLDAQNVSIQQMAWIEYGWAYSRVLYDGGEHFFKGGGKLKFLHGLMSAYMFVDNLQYNFTNDDTLSIFNTEVNYGHSSNFEWDIDGDEKFTNADMNNLITSFKNRSQVTFGLDLGLVYEYRPDYEDYKYDMDGETDLWRRDQNKYKFRAGISLIDLGRLKFKKHPSSGNFVADIRDWNIDIVDFENVSDFDDTIDFRFDFTPEGGEPYTMNLPTALSLQFDYNIYKDFYVNFTPFFAFKMKNDRHKVHQINRYTITPRWDYKWFGAFIPISYDGFKNANIGLGLRLGPIIVGARSLGSLGKGETFGFDLHLALKVPIPYGPPKDKDKDKVSDKVDKCPEVPGTWEFKGCPDTDGDHIADSEDRCPTIAGLPEHQGCPDTDGDGIMDLDDDCPDSAGVAEFNGCPDTDGDGIMDKEDECPELAGPIELSGCPDTDGDGITDIEDLCPEHAGPIENGGCPDTDGDGLFDFLDDCPSISGPRENNGCPWPDTDGDGILDKDDKCPNNAGPKENDGCPYKDTDGDGVLDKDDDCPNVPGPPQNKGCPMIEEAEQEILTTAFNDLEFETGKAIIRVESYESLRELANLLDKKPEWKIRLEGHTDNVGTDQNNLILSKKRATAVKEFLVGSGVDDTSIKVEYYGEMRPIDTNDTPEGRQRNRRVIMEIEFE